jgi:hypothetical protein
MHKDERDLLEVLKFELEFLEKGGYGRSPRAPWRPKFIFEDSPSCMNYDSKENPAPCDECVLMQLVPFDDRKNTIPCRFIPLDESGETLDSLYRHGEQHEIEEAMKGWLRATIARLEEAREAQRQLQGNSAHPSGECGAGVPFQATGVLQDQSAHPKCANPACPTAFHWLKGGKFFRFSLYKGSACAAQHAEEADCKNPCVKHYWLCETCSSVFTLVHEGEKGVMLKLLWPELPGAKQSREVTTA